jgi:hypothetical protein
LALERSPTRAESGFVPESDTGLGLPVEEPIAISRTLGRVIVTVHAALDREMASVLRPLLVDLVDNQGNLDIALELRGASSVAVENVGLIADLADRVQLRGGTLSVNRAPRALPGDAEFASP